jgi:hypothetical protein
MRKSMASLLPFGSMKNVGESTAIVEIPVDGIETEDSDGILAMAIPNSPEMVAITGNGVRGKNRAA